MSGGHDKSALGVSSGDYDMAPVASDVFDRMVDRGTVRGGDFRVIYKSALFPTSSFAYAHDLKPELAKTIRDCFFAFRFTPEMIKEFGGYDRFFPITYKEHWALVREIAEKTGAPFTRQSYEAETRREMEELSQRPR
jgi:phosphonate transport system substrate-binding protein